jgi:hypothetical protein
MLGLTFTNRLVALECETGHQSVGDLLNALRVEIARTVIPERAFLTRLS